MSANKDWWDKIEITTKVVTAVILLMGVVVGFLVNESIKESNIRVKMIEVAVRVLAEPPGTSEPDAALRTWAADVLLEYSQDLRSGLVIPKKVRAHLIANPLALAPTSPTGMGVEMIGPDGRRFPLRVIPKQPPANSAR